MKTGQLLSLAVLVSLSGLLFPPVVAVAVVSLCPETNGIGCLSDTAPSANPAFNPVTGIAGTSIANLECAAYTGEGYWPCYDWTLGIPTWGMCVAPSVCLGLGTIGITGLAIGIGKGIVGSILGGGGSSGSNVPAGGIPLTGGSKVGCSGTPYISLTPSTDSCAVYIPTGATASSTLNLSKISSNPSVGSILLNTANNGSGAAGNQSGVSNTLLSTIGATGGSASQASIGGQLINNTTSGGANSSAKTVSSSLLGGGLLTGGAYSLGANSFFNSGASNSGASNSGASNSSVSGATGLSSFLSNVGNTLMNGLSGGTNGSSASNSGTGLLNAISGNSNNTSQSGVSGLLGNYGADTGTLSNASANVANIPPKPSGVQAGTWGDIQANASGVTITAGGHDTDGRTGITGFYGYNTVPGVQPQDLAKQLCAARPWGTSSATAIIPLSFFDSVCTARGYNTSASVPAMTAGTEARTAKSKNPGATNSTTSFVKTTGTTSADVKTSLPAGRLQVPPQPAGPVYVAPRPSIVIYASPARVRIGARSTIYWSAKGVTSCTLSSPDGSFTGNTLSGAASTVALYVNTEFTIVCWTEDGSSVSKSVTVQTSS